MKNYLLFIILLLATFTSLAQQGFFRGTNNYVAPVSATSQAKALNFSSSLQNYATLPAATYFSGDFTIECWVKPTSHTNWSRIIDFGNGAGNNNVLFATSFGTSGKPGFYVGGAQYSANDQIPLNQWTHLAATLSGSTATIYINGVASGTANFPVPANVVRNSNFIGRSNWGWGDPAPAASLDELRIWSVAKTGAQIQASMNNELAGNESGLVAYFKFNEGISCGNNTAITTLLNSATSSGTAYNATLSGFTLNGSCISNFVTGKVANAISVPRLISNGLVFSLDAANSSSYPGSGTTWTDLSGNNNHTTLYNAIPFTAALPTYFSFNGSNQCVIGNTVPNFAIASTNAITAEGWIYLSANSYDFWFTSNRNPGDCTYRFGSDGGRNLYWDMGQHIDRSYSGFTFTNNSWAHVVFTGGLESGVIVTRVYVNGVLITTQNEGITSLSNTNEFFIGSGESANSHNFSGRIGSVRIYNRVLGASEIQQNFNNLRSRFGL